VNDCLTLLRLHGTLVIQGVINLLPMLMSVTPPVYPSGVRLPLRFGFLTLPPEPDSGGAPAAKHKIRTWIQRYDFKDRNKAPVGFAARKPAYRFVLVNKDPL
jgi:hypothetical protein